jgi:hypothetical protein
MMDADAGGWTVSEPYRNAAAFPPDMTEATAARIADIAAEAITGIDPHTGLASDFLNQFNEVLMLLEVTGSDPALDRDLHHWRPRGYIEHFEASHLRDSALVIEAYALCPASVRRRFDRLSGDLSAFILQGLAELHPLGGEAMHHASGMLAARIRRRVESLSAIIHPAERRLDNDTISALFEHAR